MQGIVDYLTSVTVMEMAADPRILFGLAVVLVVAVLMRWKYVILLLFAVGGVLAVVHYTNPAMGGDGLDPQMVFFVAGIIGVAIVLIYFLFIRGD